MHVNNPKFTQEDLDHYRNCPFFIGAKHDHMGKLWRLASAVGKHKGQLPEEIMNAYLELKEDECNAST